MTTTYLYRLYGKNSDLLYIGVSHFVPTRLGQHEIEQEWFSEVALITDECYPTRKEAEQRERECIATEKPRYNIAHNICDIEKARASLPPGMITLTEAEKQYKVGTHIYKWNIKKRKITAHCIAGMYFIADEDAERFAHAYWTKRIADNDVELYGIFRLIEGVRRIQWKRLQPPEEKGDTEHEQN